MILACNKTIEYSFYLLFSLVPLILTPWNYELFEFNKMILTYLLTVIIVGAWLIKTVVSEKVIFRRTPLDIPILIFLVSQFLSFLFSIDRHTSLFGYYSRFNGGLLSIISYILLYYAFVSNMSKKQTLFSILYSLFSATLVAIYGILEHFGIDEKYWVQDVRNRVFSTLGQPNWLAAYLVGLAPLTWGFVLSNYKLRPVAQSYGGVRKFKIPNSILYSLSSILYLCLLYTKSRSGLLGFAVAYLVFWSLAFLKEKKKILKPFLLFTFSILLLSFLGRTALPAFAKATTGNVITPSSEIRKVVWKGAVEIWRHHPILGTGPETFAYSYYWYRPREHNDTSEWDFLYNKAHNEYLNYLATAGVLGLGSYLLLIGAFVWWNVRQAIKLSSCQAALLSGYLGLLVCRFFGFSVVTTNLFFFLFPAMAFVLTDNTQGSNSFQPLRLERFRKYLSIFFILFAICYLLFAICKLWYADFLFAKGKKHIKADASVQAFNYFQKAASVNKSEPLFKNELSNAASVPALSLYLENEATAAAQMAQFAIQESDIALQISPYHLNYLKTRTKMFYNLAQIDQKYYQDALETLLHASEIAPTDAKVFYNLGVLYYHLGQKNEAIKIMEKTVEMKPNYEAAKKKLEEWQQ